MEYQLVYRIGEVYVEGNVFSSKSKALIQCRKLNDLAYKNGFPMTYFVRHI